MLTAEKPQTTHVLDVPDSGIRVMQVGSRWLRLWYRYTAMGKGRENPSHTGSRGLLSSIMKRLNAYRIRKGVLILGRMPDVLDGWIRPGFAAVRDQQWDVVFTTYSPYACHLIGRRLKRSDPGCYWIADFRDPWTQHHNFPGLFPFTVAERYLESSILEQADRVTTVSPQLAREFGISAEREVEVLWNGYDEQHLNRDLAIQTEPLVLVYTGTLYPSEHNYDVFLAGLERFWREADARGRSVEVKIAGRDLAGFQERVERSSVSNVVSFVGVVSFAESVRLQRTATALLLFDSDKSNGVPTGKLFEYMAAGKPIVRIGTRVTSAPTELIAQTQTGFDCADDPERLCEVLRKLGEGGYNHAPVHEIVSQFSRQAIAARFVSSVEASVVRCD